MHFNWHSIRVKSQVGELEGQMWCQVLMVDIWETFKHLKNKVFNKHQMKRKTPSWPKTPSAYNLLIKDW